MGTSRDVVPKPAGIATSRSLPAVESATDWHRRVRWVRLSGSANRQVVLMVTVGPLGSLVLLDCDPAAERDHFLLAGPLGGQWAERRDPSHDRNRREPPPLMTVAFAPAPTRLTLLSTAMPPANVPAAILIVS